MDEPVLIKRYANRKLYDQSRSRYVTLEELEELIREGREIRVVDAVSGEDLTALTLTQIILEKERNRGPFLPAGFLHLLIKHGESWQEFMQKSLQASLEGMLGSQRQADQLFREWSARTGWWFTPPGGARQEDRGEIESLRAEVAALKSRLRELEARLTTRRPSS